jgi:hypothetical protein
MLTLDVRFQWLKYVLKSQHNMNSVFFSSRTRSSFPQTVDGIGKRLIINEETIFTSELHPRNMIQSGMRMYSHKNFIHIK